MRQILVIFQYLNKKKNHFRYLILFKLYSKYQSNIISHKMPSVITLNLPLYTLFISQLNQAELLIKFKAKDSHQTYQTILQNSSSQQLFQIFEGFHDFIEHLKLSDHSSINYQSQQLVIYASGMVGKNRKYFEIHRLKLKPVEECTLQSVIQECQKPNDLTPKQLRQFIYCISAELSKIISQNKESIQIMKSYTQIGLEELQRKLSHSIEQRHNNEQQKLGKYTKVREQYERVWQTMEQSLKQIKMDFSNQIQMISKQATEKFDQLTKLQRHIIKYCVQFREVNDAEEKYIGMFVNDMKTGKGELFYKSEGDRYVGDFLNGKLHGYGIYYYGDGDRYEGEYMHDNREGYGTFYYSDGDKYQGQWKNDDREGHGTFYWSDGRKWEGQWKNDKQHGKGIYYKNGDIYEDYWQNGERQSRIKV